MFIKKKIPNILCFKNWSAYKNSPTSSLKIIKERKTPSNSLAICVTPRKKRVLFMKSYSMRLDALLASSKDASDFHICFLIDQAELPSV